MNDKNEKVVGSRFVNEEGGIVVDNSGDDSEGWVIPPGSQFGENGELIVPPDYVYDEKTETYFKVNA